MAKKQKKQKKQVKAHAFYEVAGNTLKRKSRSCPKCGPGNNMAKHNNRLTCGKCAYTEFTKKE